jgi:hypothetical protein
MSLFQVLVLCSYAAIVFSKILFVGVVMRFILELSPQIRDMRRSLAVLRAEILINRRTRAREKAGGALEREKHAESDFEELKEKVDS